MGTGTEAKQNGFRLCFEEYPVFFFNPFSQFAGEGSIYFVALVSRPKNRAAAD